MSKRMTKPVGVNPPEPDVLPEPAAPPPPRDPVRIERKVLIIVAKDCAVGNGNRKAGDVLGTLELAEGVADQELFNLFRNPELVKLKSS